MSNEQKIPKSTFTNDTTIYAIMGVSALLLFGVGYNIVSGKDESSTSSKSKNETDTDDDASEETDSDEDVDTDSDEDTE
jgi:hypothetical protein